MQALDANVGQLLPHLNTATLRTANASVRVAEMETLVRTMLADDSTPKTPAPTGDESTAGAEAIATLDSQAWARVLSQAAGLIDERTRRCVGPHMDLKVETRKGSLRLRGGSPLSTWG